MATKSRADILADCDFSLSLSSGFFGYFAHLGFILALEEKELKPRELSGSSSGALVAAGLASGRSAQELKDIFLSIEKKDFWDPRLGFGYLQGQRIEDLLNKYCVQNFADAHIPLHVSVFNIRSRKTEVLTTGPVAKACRASAAVPLLFHPVKLQGRLFWDGGIGDRAGHLGVKASHCLPVFHYLHATDWMSRLEDSWRYSLLHRKPFFFKNPEPRKIGPSSLNEGPAVIEHFYDRAQIWLAQKI